MCVEGELKERFSDHQLMNFRFSGMMDSEGVPEWVIIEALLKGAAVTRKPVYLVTVDLIVCLQIHSSVELPTRSMSFRKKPSLAFTTRVDE